MSELLDQMELFLPSFVAGGAIALFAGLLSPLVVLRRLAFVGQGISHAGFAGVGLAAVLGLTAPTLLDTLGSLGVLTGVCITAGILIGAMGSATRTTEDTLIGVVLVSAMALGSVLLTVASRGVRLDPDDPPPIAIEAWMFGSILDVTTLDAIIAWAIASAIAGVLIAMRRALMFTTFDEPGAAAFGIPVGKIRVLQMALLALAVVAAMKLAGAVLATAVLVLPGATALRVSQHFETVIMLSLGVAIIGVLGGLLLALVLGGLPAGPCIVAALVLMYAMTWLLPRREGASPASA